MKINHIIYMAGLLATAVACTSDDVSQQRDADRVPVTLSYTTQPQVDTRAAASTTLNNDYIESGKQVKVRISNYNAGSYTDYTYTTGASGALTLPDPAPYYPLDGTNIDILAYFPADASTTFTVKSDQTKDANYTASDLMWATPHTNVAKTTASRTLNFTHKMAKIVVTATAGTAVSKINSIQLLNVLPAVTFNQVTGAVGDASGDATTISVVTGNETTTATGAAVIPSQTYTSTRLLAVGVTLSNGDPGTAYYTVDSKTFSAGSVYTLDITVSYPEVGAETAITGWTEGGTAIIQRSTVQQTFDVDNAGLITFNVNGIQFNMVAVKGGNYTTLGGQDVTGTLSDYYIGQTQVTQALWKAVMGSVPTGQTNDDERCPVAKVTWLDICGGSYTVADPNQTVAVADCFLTKLNAAVAGQLPTGKKFNLPSEAQWEYAARGGQYKENYTYVGTSDQNDLANRAWYNVNSDSKTHPVALKKANSLGLYDMNGNVWEWCLDWYNTTVATSRGADYVEGTPTRQSNGHDYRVLRGGSWSFGASYCAVSSRGYDYPSNVTTSRGLRLVLQ